MDDTGVVDGAEGVEQGMAEVDELVLGEGTVLPDIVGQGLTVDEFGDDERLRGVEFGVEHLGDAGVADPPQRAHLPGQPFARGLVAGDVRVEDFDGHRIVAAVDTEVDDAHAARAELLDEAVASQILNHHGHKGSRASRVRSKQRHMRRRR